MKRGRQEDKTSRSSKHQRHNEIENSNGIHIPFDLIVKIVSRLPFKSLVRFQCVSKLWSCLIIDTFMSTRPRDLLLVIFPHWLLQSSLFSTSTYYPLNTTKDRALFFHTDQFRSYVLRRGLCCELEYGYIRELVCRGSSKVKKRFSLPEITHPTWYHSCDDVLGCDLVDNKVFKLLGGPKKQKWIKSFDDHSPRLTSSGLCINGTFYYIAQCDVNQLVRFDITFNRFDHIKMPITLQTNHLDNLTLVNYQGKLGCIRLISDRVQIWIMDEKREWSKIICDTPPFQLTEILRGTNRIAGVTPNGMIAIMPNALDSTNRKFCAYYYYPKLNIVFEIGNGRLYPKSWSQG